MPVCVMYITGNATRMCLPDLTWADPDVTNCQSRVFVDIMERVSRYYSTLYYVNRDGTEEAL